MMTMSRSLLLCALGWSVGSLCLAGTNDNASVASQPAGHITGIGGIFFKAKDPKALAAWYRDVLGMPVAPWGGALLRADAPQHPPVTTWSAFSSATKYFTPSEATFMINYAVDDMDALLARLKEKGIEALKRDDADANGRFAWVLDPEGNKVELWEPKQKADH